MKQYDFALNWSGTIKERFVALLQMICRKKHLSFLWISDDTVKDTLKKLENDKIKIKILLDTEATYNKKGDIYARLCYAVKDSGGIVINDPDRAKMAIDKSILHYELLNAGIPVPYTVVVRNWEPNNFKLTDDQKKKLGAPLVIKPALGFGQLGVVRDARGSIREIARARNFDRGDNFLLQEKIFPAELGGKRAWFRVMNVFDTIIPCWWDDRRNIYEHVCYEEFNMYRLFPLVKIVAKIAEITRMAWFSTEVAVDNKTGQTRSIAIDYVNDQCDMTARSESENGVPDPVVEYVADAIVDNSYRLLQKQKVGKKYTIWLKDADIELKGLGYSPDLLKQEGPDGVVSGNKLSGKLKQIFRKLKPGVTNSTYDRVKREREAGED